MVTCGTKYRVFNPETQQWVRFDDFAEADQAEVEWLYGKAAKAVKEGRQVILLSSQVKRMEQAGMLSKDRGGRVATTPAPKVSE